MKQSMDSGTQRATLGRPFTGAWIETIVLAVVEQAGLSPLHGGVD